MLAVRPGAVCFVLVFSFSFCTSRLRIARWESRLPVGPVDFQGIVTDPGSPLPGDPFGMRLQKVRLADGTPVMIRTDLPARRGDRIEGRTVFECARGSRNPGGFSERNWLWSQGAVWLGGTGSFRLLQRKGLLLEFRRLADRIRDYVRQHHFPLWQTSCGPLLLSLAAGDTRLLDDKQTYFLRTSGLSHLTSVSGTHLIFLLGPLNWIIRKGRFPHRVARGITLPLTLLPGILSGWKCGISRASLVAFASRLDLGARQRRDEFNLLLLAGSVMLAANPYALFDTSFWMSLSAAGAVSHTAKRLAARPGPSLLLKVRAALAFSLVAQLVVLPYQIMTAPGIHLLAPLLNMLALPLAAYLMAATYPAIFILSVLPQASGAFTFTVRFFTSILNPAAGLLTGLSRAVARTHDAFIPLSPCLLLLPLLLLSLYVLPQKRRNMRALAVLAAVFLVWLAIVSRTGFAFQGSRVLFLDVGQGDATLFIPEGGRAFLIDGGDKKHGYNTVIPAARMQAVTFIDLAILTHAHSDHAAGIAELIEAGFIGHLCLPDLDAENHEGARHEEDMTADLLELSAQCGVPVTRLVAGDWIRTGDCLIQVLHPDRRRGPVDLNEASLVMRVTLDGLSVLMTGDLTQEGEAAILSAGIDCSADLLHLAHHGSRYSSSQAFLDACGPVTALISSGAGNRYGHPHPETINRLLERSIRLVRTDESGAVFLKIRGGKGSMKGWLTRVADQEFLVGEDDTDR